MLRCTDSSRRTIRRGARSRTRRGSVVMIALWSIALGAIIAGAVQIASQRQSMTGRQALARVQARWAARAGVERIISILGYHNENPDPDDAMRVYLDMGEASDGELFNATYRIRHHFERQEWAGPMDEHAKLNINEAPRDRLEAIPDMLPYFVDAIVDWIDEDDIVTGDGAEAPYYLTSAFPFSPRNAPMRSIAELELVRDVRLYDLRREDWNLNNILDPNEDDGDVMMPFDDNSDGVLEANWSGLFTAQSVRGGLTASGLDHLYLPDASVDEIRDRLGLSQQQAQALSYYVSNPDNTLAGLWITPLANVNPDGSISQQMVNSSVLPLDSNQYRALFQEATLDIPTTRPPGRVNINTASEEMLRLLLDPLNPALADEIVARRRAKPQGYTSLVELLESPRLFTAPVLAEVMNILDVRSNVFTITSIGRSETTGLEVQLIVVVDRSTLPVHILEYREQ